LRILFLWISGGGLLTLLIQASEPDGLSVLAMFCLIVEPVAAQFDLQSQGLIIHALPGRLGWVENGRAPGPEGRGLLPSNL